ncbi:MAG TPA: 30S ribosomal protein S6 [Alphaproteobacteria bacterium]|nr:30S ribosomal protein S6 [Alphaproteobacteria bacterium]
MSYYETVFIVRQDMSPSQVEAMADSYAEVLSQYEGSVIKREMWGLRNLAFRINKNRKGHYVMMHIDTPPAGLNEIERQMRLSEDVLRYMSVRVEEVPEGPSPMLQQRERGERAPREGRGEGRGRDREDREERPRREERPQEGENVAASSAAEGV